jgi:DNA-binding HxlR family transcriptional regulator
MNHSFNVEIAKEYGIEEAIILENMYFWLEKNRVNQRHIIDGKVWTYNSQSALSELFPYMNRSKIQRVMTKLEDLGLILRANYNIAKYDKTTWYALTPHGYSLFNMNNGLCNLNNGLLNINNRISQNEQPIPDINTNINSDINQINTISKDIVSSTKVQPIISAWNSLGLQNIISIKPSSTRYKLLNARIKEYGEDKVIKAIENIKLSNFLKGQNNKNWTITFDWFIKPNNFIKVLEGNYADRDKTTKTGTANKEKVPLRFNNFEAREYDYDALEEKLLGWDKD